VRERGNGKSKKKKQRTKGGSGQKGKKVLEKRSASSLRKSDIKGIPLSGRRDAGRAGRRGGAIMKIKWTWKDSTIQRASSSGSEKE